MKNIVKLLKEKNRKWIFIAIIIVVIILFFLVSYSKRSDYYVIRPRVDRLNQKFNGKNETYETVGWIQIQGTSIDLPVLYSFQVSYPVEEEGYAKMPKYIPGFHNHLEISGHNIFNLSSRPVMQDETFARFESLMSFVYYDFAKENQYIQLTYGKEEYLYKIFMVGFISRYSYSLLPFDLDYTESDMETFLKGIEDYNIYHYDVDVNKNDSVIVLSTCTRFFGERTDLEFYVVGRLLRKNEAVNHYSVTKSKRYVDVEKILKGSEENEEM